MKWISRRTCSNIQYERIFFSFRFVLLFCFFFLFYFNDQTLMLHVPDWISMLRSVPTPTSVTNYSVYYIRLNQKSSNFFLCRNIDGFIHLIPTFVCFLCHLAIKLTHVDIFWISFTISFSLVFFLYFLIFFFFVHCFCSAIFVHRQK